MSSGELTEGRLLSGLSRLAVPMLIGALLQNAQSLIDLFWVGSLGATAVAGVAMGGTVMMVVFPMLLGVATGTVATVSRAIGRGEVERAGEFAAQSIMLSLVLGVIFGALGWFFSPHMLDLLNATPEVKAVGTSYLRISLLGSFTVFVLFIANSALQGAGDSLTPMYVMGAANILNIILDPILIFGVGPFPEMGVRGAALATVIAQALAAALSLYLLCNGHTRLHLKPPLWKPRPAMAWHVMRIGIPGSGQMFSRSLMGVMMMRIVASTPLHEFAVAAYGIGIRLHMIILMPAFALGGAAATLVGQNLGADKPERAHRSAWLAAGIDAGFMAVLALILVLLAPQIIGAFNRRPEVIQIGAHYLRVTSPFYIFAAFGIVLTRALQGAGDTMATMVITVISLWVVQVPLAVWLSRMTTPPTSGIWYAICAAMTLQALLVIAWFETGRWKRARV